MELERLQLEVARLERENAELRACAIFDEQLGSDTTRYQVIVSKLAEGVVLQSADGQILTCNPAAERILGLSVDQLAGRSSLDPRWRAIHEDGAPFPGETHPAMVSLRTGHAMQNVIMGVHKLDEALTWISINSQPLFKPGANQPHAVVSSFVDVTAHKQSEARARVSEEKLRFALQAARMGTWDWNARTGQLHWSDDVEAIFGLEQGALAQTYAAYVSLVHPEDRRDYEASVQRTLVRDAQSDDFINEHRVLDPQGVTRWVVHTGRVLRDEQGEGVGMAGTVADISARKSLENQLMLSQRMETVGRLAGGVAHDFNNLLTVILSCAEATMSDSQLDPGVRDALSMIREASERAALLTRQLLSYACRQVFDLEVLDLSALVRDMQRLLSRIIGEDIEIETRLGEGEVKIRADRAQIEQVLVNLAVNAREAMPKGGSLRIELGVGLGVGLGLRPGHALLEVTDSGHGIAESTLPQIFDPFFTTKQDGTGLGLSTCYGIVKQLGGDIKVDSEAGVGTRFSIYLPLTSEPESAKRDAVRPTPRRGRGRILLAEDDAVVRMIAERGLRAQGYEVLAASDGRAAFELLTSDPSPIDLLVSDVIMPNMTGYELGQAMRERFPDLALLFVSGYADGAIDDASALPKLTNTTHLLKPYTVSRLVEVVGHLLAEAPGGSITPGGKQPC